MTTFALQSTLPDICTLLVQRETRTIANKRDVLVREIILKLFVVRGNGFRPNVYKAAELRQMFRSVDVNTTSQTR